MSERGWRNVRPQGDTRKLPKDWAILRWQMVLRLAYFVFIHEIPRALVINADHTGIMFTQVKVSRARIRQSRTPLALMHTLTCTVARLNYCEG